LLIISANVFADKTRSVDIVNLFNPYSMAINVSPNLGDRYRLGLSVGKVNYDGKWGPGIRYSDAGLLAYIPPGPDQEVYIGFGEALDDYSLKTHGTMLVGYMLTVGRLRVGLENSTVRGLNLVLGLTFDQQN